MERCIGGKACLERTLMVLEPQISTYIKELILDPHSLKISIGFIEPKKAFKIRRFEGFMKIL